MKLSNIHSAYFIGVGGIGMSALARYFVREGVQVFGYDRTETELTKKLVDEGVTITYDDDVKTLPEDVDIVIYTPAIPDDNKIMNSWQSRDKRLFKRAEVLGLINQDKSVIGVAGTHGKTTTSSMLAHLLRESGIDITAFLGGIATNFEGNFVHGKSDWVVIEADEYDRSFLQLHPKMAIITSLDPDHLDIYGDEDEMKRNYLKFLSQVEQGGTVIMHSDVFNQLTQDEISKLHQNVEIIVYGEKMIEATFRDVKYNNGIAIFDWIDLKGDVHNTSLSMPGNHNISNAIAAMTVCEIAELENKTIAKSLRSFEGIKRRFETRYKDENIVLIDDYAHHPRELEAAISAAKAMFPKKKITGVFQPHLYSRTKDFYKGFACSLQDLDEVWILDIYPARELPIKGVTANLIASEMIHDHITCTNMKNIINEIKLDEVEVLLILGAGDIVNTIPHFIQKIKEV